jgi:hypothetical protein
MTPMPLRAIRAGTLLLALVSTSPAAAESLAIDPPASQNQVRTTDQRLARLVFDGMRTSPTFRSLVDRLNSSDVVVYLRCDSAPPLGIAGRLSFLGTGGGFRYVIVRVSYLPSHARQLAILGHELQHAVEVAETPQIIDPESLAREYTGNVGYPTFWSTASGRTYDSAAANEVGSQVLREMNEANARTARTARTI